MVRRSVQPAQAAQRGRRGRRRGADASARREAVDPLLTRYRVHSRRPVRSTERFWERPLRREGGRDTPVRLAWAGPGRVRLDPEAVAAAGRPLGWRVDGTTQPPDPLARQEAVLASRHEYLGERARGRLKGRPVSWTPMALEREAPATGLIRLWSLGLRVLTRLEVGVRRRLALAKTPLAGLSVGHPKRATAHPTAERLVEAFPGLTWTIIREGRRRHLTRLSHVQHRILTLLEFPVAISTRRCPDSHKPP